MSLVALQSARATARSALLRHYAGAIATNTDLDRSLVSFQANKDEPLYRWLKYKEGFSHRLIRYFLARLGDEPGVMLDPFAGAGAALFASRDAGWHARGIELLPVGVYAVEVRLAAEKVVPETFAGLVQEARRVSFGHYCPQGFEFPHIRITRQAFPPESEGEIGGYLAFCEKEIRDPCAQKLFRFACFSVLEEVSYTRKDGQYLRWDHRSPRSGVKGRFHKGRLPSFREAVLRKLRTFAEDLQHRPLVNEVSLRRGALDIRQGSCLDVLPEMEPETVHLVITSPPYCNRYDYTRTYALELAFLGHSDADVKRLRQAMLSCTVENREKDRELRRAYSRRRRLDDFILVDRTFTRQAALAEVLAFLEDLRSARRLNNANIARMVRNYFYEMCFAVYELARVLRPGGTIIMVNDNVRYAGEEVPVDLILSDFAVSFGLSVKHIWTLPRGKGNSSQQMGAHGRRELRKCVYVWHKPC
jgi:hypothetical protein